MSLRDIACDVGECKRNTSQTHTMVKFENTFSTKLKKNHFFQISLRQSPLLGEAGRESFFANRFASIVPLMLCHAQLMAQGTTARGQMAVLTKKLVASTVPSPAFCIPTSMERVRFLAVENLQSEPTE